MKTREFNLQNWTGETAVVSYTKAGKFSFYGYDFQIKVLKKEPKSEFIYAELVSPSWDEPLKTFCCWERDVTKTLEDWVITAVRYIANHV